MSWNISLIKKIFGYVRPHWVCWSIGNICDIGGLCFFSVCITYAIKAFLDGTVYRDRSLIQYGVFLVVIALIAMCVLEGGYKFLYGRAMAQIRTEMKEDIFGKLLHLPMMKEKGKSAAEWMVMLNQDVDNAMGFMGENLTNVISAAVMTITSIVCIGSNTLLCGIFCLAVFGVMVGVYAIWIPRHQENTKALLNCQEQINTSFNSARQGGASIRVNRLGGLMESVFERQLDALQQCKTQTRMLVRKQNLLINGLSQLMILVPLLVGTFLCFKGVITIGTLFFNFNFTMNITGYANQLCDGIIKLSRSQSSLERLDSLKDAEQEAEAWAKTILRDYEMKTGHLTPYCIQLSNINVTMGEQKVLQHLNLDVKQGEFLTVVGESGEGKSTLIYLLLGFVQFTGGYRLYGQEILNDHLQDVSKLMSYVPQNPILFSATIRENIAYGNEKATEEEICEAAERVGLRPLLERLPDGINTEIGNAGENLSGGERQRIAIARAILKQAPILLLDECTSALDYENEQKILEMIKKLTPLKTVLMVAHRKGAIKAADRIVWMRGGQMEENEN